MFHRLSYFVFSCWALLLAGLLGHPADAGVMFLQNFNDLAGGDIVTNQFAVGPGGFTVSGTQRIGDSLPAQFETSEIVAFDTFATSTADPDLEDPFSGPDGIFATRKDNGNIASNIGDPNLVDAPNAGSFPTASRFQRALIIQENEGGRPDDEGSRPAGSITFDFEEDIASIGFDLLDVEGSLESFRIELFQDGTSIINNSESSISLSDFITQGTDFFDSTLRFGNNTANRITPIAAAQFGAESFDRFTLNFGGSGAIDNLLFTLFVPPDPVDPGSSVSVPEPAAATVWAAVGLAGLIARRRRNQKSSD